MINKTVNVRISIILDIRHTSNLYCQYNLMTTQIPEKRQNLIDIFVHRNEQINLSAIRKPEDIYVKHILDSLELTKIFNLQHNEVSSLSPNEWKETK